MTSLELVPEEPSEPVPPLIVDRERLKVSLAIPRYFSVNGRVFERCGQMSKN